MVSMSGFSFLNFRRGFFKDLLNFDISPDEIAICN